MANLEQEASSPQTPPARLQELANNYPRLRPLIAMNPATYPALVQWLGTLDDPSVNVALAQRDALNQSGGGGPRRVSVMGREYSQDTNAPSAGMGGPAAGTQGTQGTQATPGPQSAPASPQTSGTSAGGPNHPFSAVTASPSVAAASATAPENTTSNRTSNVPLVALILVLTAVIVLAFVAYRLLTPSKSTSSTEAAESAAVTAEEEGAAEAAVAPAEENATTETIEEAPETPQFPAPSSALSLSIFVSPSGNIACSLGAESVTCTINSYSFVSDDMQSCGAGPLSITANAEKAGVDCAATAVQGAGATTLAYEDFAANGNTACRSTEDGIACWNTMTGVGFGISRSGYLIGLTGPVDPREFPWA